MRLNEELKKKSENRMKLTRKIIQSITFLNRKQTSTKTRTHRNRTKKINKKQSIDELFKPNHDGISNG